MMILNTTTNNTIYKTQFIRLLFDWSFEIKLDLKTVLLGVCIVLFLLFFILCIIYYRKYSKSIKQNDPLNKVVPETPNSTLKFVQPNSFHQFNTLNIPNSDNSFARREQPAFSSFVRMKRNQNQEQSAQEPTFKKMSTLRMQRDQNNSNKKGLWAININEVDSDDEENTYGIREKPAMIGSNVQQMKLERQMQSAKFDRNQANNVVRSQVKTMSLIEKRKAKIAERDNM